MAERRNAQDDSRTTTDRRKMLWCKRCRHEFLTYRMTGKSRCPNCQRRCGDTPPRSARVADADLSENATTSQAGQAVKVVLGLAILGALAFGAWKIYENPNLVRDLRDHFNRPPEDAPAMNAVDGDEPAGNEPADVEADSPEGAADPTP